MTKMKTAIAIGAHPDDIELMMAGTLLLLKKAGYAIHYLNVSSGNVGSIEFDSATTAELRKREAQRSAEILGAHYHPSFCSDLEIFYNEANLRKLTAIIREVKPAVVLTHSPSDYMEDHMITCRLVVTAVFARGMPNFGSDPSRDPYTSDCTIYHALPHTLRDQLRKRVIPGAFVNTASVQELKMEALRAHESQQNWLDVSQKMNSYLKAMEDISLTVGKMSHRFAHAEGWRRHLHFGFCDRDADPLNELGSNYLINEAFERDIENEF
jgi:N-acetylglucosamine malate deacetylase 1